ncbi:MAG: hypothetical protein LUH07_11645 [Lachnospiraceae bacterium]|nr:hypothetical protein [Lachnospiraceae bacterium]
MKKKSLMCLLCGILMLSTCLNVNASDENETEMTEEATETETEYDGPAFKSFYWGDSKDTVIAEEGEPYSTGEMTAYEADYIVYDTTVSGLDCLLVYYFCDEGLFTVKYILTEDHSTYSIYIDDYDKLVSGVTSKYGDPLLNNDSWTSDSKKEYYSGQEGKALVYGYLERAAYWFLSETVIGIHSSADNYSVTTYVQYESLSISPGEADYSSDF